MERTFGLLLSGFAVKLAGAALALYIGSEVAAYITDVFGQVEGAIALRP